MFVTDFYSGPLTSGGSGEQGHKYLLTSICLGSKNPEAVPLKQVDAKSVADAMLEVFARTGLPQEILQCGGLVAQAQTSST